MEKEAERSVVNR